MLQSRLAARTSKEAPKEEVSKNAILLEQAGFIQKVLSGVYTFMPLGSKVLRKIENIVREEMDQLGDEILMPALQPKENWIKTERWEGFDVLFKLESQHGFEYALGPTHEEIVAPALQKIINSYRDLPLAVYQIQTKFRDEVRAKSGLMRGREFRMKDLYSFHESQEDLEQYYNKVSDAYLKLFKRLGLNAILTEASGGSFSKFSHEFQAETESGEDTIYICEKCGLAKNQEIYSGEHEECTNCGKTKWRKTQGCEIGNIFKLGTKFSEPFGVMFTDKDGNSKPVVMGCYGIGTTRLMGVIAEIYNDKNGLIWPESVAPFKVHILPLTSKNPDIIKKIMAEAHKTAEILQAAGVEVLLDDRDESAGVKFKDSDLFGIPHRVIISEKTLEKDSVEYKNRNQKDSEMVSPSQISKKLGA